VWTLELVRDERDQQRRRSLAISGPPRIASRLALKALVELQSHSRPHQFVRRGALASAFIELIAIVIEDKEANGDDRWGCRFAIPINEATSSDK